jgi:hypothetical protein
MTPCLKLESARQTLASASEDEPGPLFFARGPKGSMTSLNWRRKVKTGAISGCLNER